MRENRHSGTTFDLDTLASTHYSEYGAAVVPIRGSTEDCLLDKVNAIDGTSKSLNYNCVINNFLSNNLHVHVHVP